MVLYRRREAPAIWGFDQRPGSATCAGPPPPYFAGWTRGDEHERRS